MAGEYQPAADFNPESSPAPVSARRKRSGGLVAICVMSLVLGGLGVVTILQTIAGMAMSGTDFGFGAPAAGAPNEEAQRLQEEMQTKMNNAASKWNVVTWILTAALVVNTALLVAGGIMALRMNPLGRKLLLIAFISAFAVDLARTIPGALASLEMFQVMEEYMPLITEASAPPGRPGAQQAADAMATMFSIMGIAIAVVMVIWTVAKLTFYAIGFLYLKRPAVQALFT